MTAKTATPLTDAQCLRKLDGPGPTWLEFACKLESDRARLIALLEKAQSLRPTFLKRDGIVPLCVLEFCNEARSLLRELGEGK